MQHIDPGLDRTSLRRWTRPALVLLCAVAPGACGNVTAGGVGETEVYMSGDASGPTPTTSPSFAVVGEPEPPPGPGPLLQIVGAGLEGEVEVTASLFLVAEGGSRVELTPGGAATVTVDIAGADEPRVLREAVPATSYEAVVVVFTDVTAEVTGGLEIGGVPFTGTVEVDLGGGDLEVTRSLDIVIPDGAVASLLVDLNAADWVPLVDILTGTVTAQAFAGAVAVTER